MAEADGLAFFKEMSHLWVLTVQGDANHRLKLSWKVVDEKGIIGRDLYLQTIGLENEVIAVVVIEVPMCCQQMNGFQLLGFDILLDGLMLIFKIGATINDHTLACVITHHIGVFLQLVAFESLNGYHLFKREDK